MDDLDKYIENFKKQNPDLEKNFDIGYNDFRIKVLELFEDITFGKAINKGLKSNTIDKNSFMNNLKNKICNKK